MESLSTVLLLKYMAFPYEILVHHFHFLPADLLIMPFHVTFMNFMRHLH